MGKHARMFRNVVSNLGNEILDCVKKQGECDFEAEL